MNYAHAFHAGNFADVLKHAVLARVLCHLCEKPAAYRVIDTHAGADLYDLAGPEAARCSEWHGGIKRLHDAHLADDAKALLVPYLQVIDALNERGRLTVYPGSPALIRAWLRPHDRLIACELEPKAASALAANMRGDPRIKTLRLDGWTALAAYLPPKERRGLLLVDPPFEAEDDFRRLSQGLAAAHRKWASGIYMLWYPIKDRGEPDALAKRLRRLALPKTLRAELTVGPASDFRRLNGCGLIVTNPPWRLADELAILLPALAKILSAPGQGSFRLDWLAAERPAAAP